MRKTSFLDIVLAAIAVVGGICVCCDIFGEPCYWFNAIYLALVLPACIGLSSWPERLRPDLFDRK